MAKECLELATLIEGLTHYVTPDHSCPHLADVAKNPLCADFAWKEKIHLYSVVESTNTEARNFLAQAMANSPLHHKDGSLTKQGAAVHGSIFLAEEQTGGKGRQGRNFFSPQSSGLYLTLVIVPHGGVTEPALLTATAGVAVCKAIQQVYGIELGIKWVNDIFYQGKKIGGILAEGVMDSATGTVPAAVVGIGINLAPPKNGFPQELKDIAGSLLSSPTEDTRKKELIPAIVHHLLQFLEAVQQKQTKPLATTCIMEEYRKLSILKPGHRVQVFPIACSTQESYSATVLSIDYQAQLLVQTEDGKQKILDSGEVSLKSENFT